jgi:hypothetical protein
MEILTNLGENWAGLQWRRLFAKGEITVYLGLISWDEVDNSSHKYSFIEPGEHMYKASFHVGIAYGANQYCNLYPIDNKINLRADVEHFIKSFIKHVESGNEINEILIKQLMYANGLVTNRMVQQIAFGEHQSEYDYSYDLVALESKINEVSGLEDKVSAWRLISKNIASNDNTELSQHWHSFLSVHRK